ncbi:EX1 [Auxenochlorella protothecoides x Auxenochlorella symbiontica]
MPGVRLKNPTVGNPPASPPRTRTCRHARVVRACHAAPDSGGRHRDPFPRTSIPGSTHAPPQKAREVGAGVDNSVDQAPAAAQAALTPATASDLEEDADWQDWKAVMARTHSLAEAHEEACAALDSSVALDAYAAAAALRDRLAGIRAQDCLGEALAELDRAVAAERYAAAASLRDMAWAGLPGWWSGRGDRGDVAGHLIRVSRRYGHYAAHAFSGRDLAAALGWAPDAVFEYVSLGGGDEDAGAGEADPAAQAVLEMHFRRGAGGALEAQAVAVLGPAEAEEVESADDDELAEVVVAVQGVEVLDSDDETEEVESEEEDEEEEGLEVGGLLRRTDDGSRALHAGGDDGAEDGAGDDDDEEEAAALGFAAPGSRAQLVRALERLLTLEAGLPRGASEEGEEEDDAASSDAPADAPSPAPMPDPSGAGRQASRFAELAAMLDMVRRERERGGGAAAGPDARRPSAGHLARLVASLRGAVGDLAGGAWRGGGPGGRGARSYWAAAAAAADGDGAPAPPARDGAASASTVAEPGPGARAGAAPATPPCVPAALEWHGRDAFSVSVKPRQVEAALALWRREARGGGGGGAVVGGADADAAESADAKADAKPAAGETGDALGSAVSAGRTAATAAPPADVDILGPGAAARAGSGAGGELPPAPLPTWENADEAEAALRTTGAMEQVLKAVAKQLEGAVDGVDGEVWSALQSALAAVAAKRERDARALRALRYNIPVHAEVGPVSGPQSGGARRGAEGARGGGGPAAPSAAPPRAPRAEPELQDRVSFRRIRAPRGDALAGVYLGQFGPHGPEVVQLARSRRDGDEWVHATKITGDRNVPAGELSFKARVGREHRLPTAVEGYPPELGVTARYAGRGRVAEPGFKNPRWVNAELLQFASGNPMTRGAELGIVFSVSRTQRYLILFNRVDLESLEEDASSLGP